MTQLGGQAAARAKLIPERLDLSTPERQVRVIERAVAGALLGPQKGGQGAKAASVVIEGVRAVAKIQESAGLAEEVAALKAELRDLRQEIRRR